MKKIWRIKNISAQPIKIAGALTSSESKGIIISPGEVCFTDNRLTSSIDKQQRSGFITITEIDNFEGVVLCKSMPDTLEGEIKKVQEYIN